MNFLENIQNIVFENSENLKNDTYINIQNELMKLHNELKDNDMQKHIDLLLYCKKLEAEVKRFDDIFVDSKYDLSDGYWKCCFCYNKESHNDTHVLYNYNGYLQKIYCCYGCINYKKIIKTEYKIDGIYFGLRPKGYLQNNITGLDVKYQYLNRKYLDISKIIGKAPTSKKLEDIQNHFGIDLGQMESTYHPLKNYKDSLLNYKSVIFFQDNSDIEILKCFC